MYLQRMFVVVDKFHGNLRSISRPLRFLYVAMCQSEDTIHAIDACPVLILSDGCMFQINIALSTITCIRSPRHAPKLILNLSYGMMFSRLICIQLETLCIKLGRGACKIYEHSITHL